MKHLFLIGSLLASLFMLACKTTNQTNDYTKFVDPFIGTGGHGHTFPGVTLPHGMVQLSPDTRMEGWDACSGYHYSDSTIIGFSHTHLSGTGIGDYGDILLMPTADCDKIERGEEDNPASGYRSRFSHSTEKAYPGYYSVHLEDYDILAELTATMRAGMHRYTFPKGKDAAVVLDLGHTLQNHKNLLLSLRIISDTEIDGVKQTSGWAKDHLVCFNVKFSKPFKAELFVDGQPSSQTTVSGNDIKVRLSFDTSDDQTIMAKMGISGVDTKGAKNNLDSEIPDWDFDRVTKEANAKWNAELAKIEVQTNDSTSKKIFYTALYHAMISPNTFIDVDRRYRGQDLQTHTADNGEYYTVFSLWDTFRALHPLLNIINPQLNESLIRTLIAKSDEGGFLPMWDLASNYTGTMIGYHAVSVIVEGYMKGLRGFDAEKAFEACVKASKYVPVDIKNIDNGINSGSLKPIALMYKDSLGYVPSDKDNESVAKALEYAYNDWCIAQFAKALGKQKEYEEFSKKALYYRNYFDPTVGFMRGKLSDGTWREPFDPAASNHRQDDYCEGNAWQWSWYVMHDVQGLIDLHGGKDKFASKLDDLFNASSQLKGDAVSSDISGLIGQYAHGNEPSHHITHLYNYVGQSWKTQELVDSILYSLYFADPNGLAGNEDCGQMSSWYILNAMGIYSVAPASCMYTFGRPIFDKVTINLSPEKRLNIVTVDNSRDNKFIQAIVVDGKPHNSAFISHEQLMAASEIKITMGAQPNKNFGL